jgi:hypothetical protein
MCVCVRVHALNTCANVYVCVCVHVCVCMSVLNTPRASRLRILKGYVYITTWQACQARQTGGTHLCHEGYAGSLHHVNPPCSAFSCPRVHLLCKDHLACVPRGNCRWTCAVGQKHVCMMATQCTYLGKQSRKPCPVRTWLHGHAPAGALLNQDCLCVGGTQMMPRHDFG